VGTNSIFVSNQDDDTVSVISRATNAVTNTITVGDQPFGMALYSPGGVDTHLFVANIQSNTVSVIDLASMSVVGTYQ
jgi:YVTN family beta-propeller protein